MHLDCGGNRSDSISVTCTLHSQLTVRIEVNLPAVHDIEGIQGLSTPVMHSRKASPAPWTQCQIVSQSRSMLVDVSASDMIQCMNL